MTSFSLRFATLVKEKGWTQTEAAQFLGISQTLVSAYLCGKRVPLPRTIDHIAQRLGISPEELTGDKARKGTPALNLSESASRAMKNLKRRWKRKQADHSTIRHLIEALFPEDAAQIISWLDKG